MLADQFVVAGEADVALLDAGAQQAPGLVRRQRLLGELLNRPAPVPDREPVGPQALSAQAGIEALV